MSHAPAEIFPETGALENYGGRRGGVAAEIPFTIGEKMAMYEPVLCFVYMRQEGECW